ncbi:MAG: hypothetical protein J5734_05495 [Prevotella sp.]|nr:hypothetical protein [Prevotella sp.]MBR5036933.1 hypothetical protein [Prevotella sp.]MBR5697556.1 hypothetical protein [Prevotella sp.]
MKKTLITLLLAVLTLSVSAQQQQRPQFDPAKFDADLEQFITTEAALSPQEAAQFFPLYREMLRQQRVLYMEMRRHRHIDFNDNKACREVIEKQDKIELQMKEIQQQYHNKFFKVLPASKVWKVIRAEESFHRQAFRRVAKPPQFKR